MALNFPINPSAGDLYQPPGGPQYRFTGTYWQVFQPNSALVVSASFSQNAITATQLAAGATASYASFAETASVAEKAQTASFITASNVIGIVESASFALTASYLSGSSETSSYALTASYVENALTASFITGSDVVGVVESASFALTASYLDGISATASLALTASYVENAQSASFITGSDVKGIVESASFALTASYIENAQSASFITGSDVKGIVASASVAENATTASLLDFTDNIYEIHVDDNKGEDKVGNGSLLYPYKTIGYAVAQIGTAQGRRIIIHRGIYNEDVTLTTPNTAIVGYEGGNGSLIKINGTLTINYTGTSTRISNLKIDNLVHSGASDLYLLNVDLDGQATFAGTGYVEISNSMIEPTGGIFVTGTSTVFSQNSTFYPLIQNNAASVVYMSNNIATIAPTLQAGTLVIVDSLVYSAASGSNAITTSPGSILNLTNTQVTTAAGVPERINVGGFLSYDNIVFDKVNSNLGTALPTTAHFQKIDGEFTGVIENASTASFVTASNVIGIVESASYALTASYVLGSSETSSYALTASYIENALTASFVTASNVFGIVESSSYALTASYVLGSSETASYALTASYVENALTASFVTASNVIGNILSASYALTASYALNVLNAGTASAAVNTADKPTVFNGKWAFSSASIGKLVAPNTVGSIEDEVVNLYPALSSLDSTPIPAIGMINWNGAPNTTGSVVSYGIIRDIPNEWSGSTGDNIYCVRHTNLDNSVQYFTNTRPATGSYQRIGRQLNGIPSSATVWLLLDIKPWFENEKYAENAATASLALSASHLINFNPTPPVTVSGSAPTNEVEVGDLWYNNTNGNTYIYQSASTWVPISADGGGGGSNGATRVFTQTPTSQPWVLNHNFNTTDVLVQVYDATGSVVIPRDIVTTDANNVTVYFDAVTAGKAIVTTGAGVGVATTAETASYATTASFATSASYAVTASYALSTNEFDWSAPTATSVAATGTNPLKGTTLKDTMRYRKVNSNTYEVQHALVIQSGGSTGDGDYTFRLPVGIEWHPDVEFDTAVVADSGAQYASDILAKAIPATGFFGTNSFDRFRSVWLLPFNSTRFRVWIQNGTGGAEILRSSPWGLSNSGWTLHLQFYTNY